MNSVPVCPHRPDILSPDVDTVSHAHSPLSKSKYMAVRRAMHGFHRKKKLVNLVPWLDLSLYIRTIDVGKEII